MGKLIPMTNRKLRARRFESLVATSVIFASRLRYYLAIPWTQLRQTFHNGWGILNVWDLILLRPMRGGLIADDHPFCTGTDPATGEPVWSRNLIYASPRRSPADPEADCKIIEAVGRYMAAMTRSAASTDGYPCGKPNRMPPGIYFIHGPVHYNGGWLLFDDFPDAIEHFTDPRFVAELRHFAVAERREPLVVFREAIVDPRAYAEFIGFLRTNLPWFSNSNGRAQQRPLWGNGSPHAVVNIVTGNWISDTRMLMDARGRERAARPPIAARYFQDGPYRGDRRHVLWPERWISRVHDLRIRARRERGDVYFVDRRRFAKGLRFDPTPPASLWRRLRDRLEGSG